MPVEKRDFREGSTRHLMCHVWPVSGTGVWQWNADRLLRSADLFNGRRIIAIATSPDADDPDEVRGHLKALDAEFIVVQNSPHFGEVASFLPTLRLLEPYQSDADVTFRCHARGVRYKLRPAVTDQLETMTFPTTEALYDACLRWNSIRPLLEKSLFAGAILVWGGVVERRILPSWNYFGGFYWFRNKEVFQSKWEDMPQHRQEIPSRELVSSKWADIPPYPLGAEVWPGLMFPETEASSVICTTHYDVYNRYANKNPGPNRSLESEYVFYRDVLRHNVRNWRERNGIPTPVFGI